MKQTTAIKEILRNLTENKLTNFSKIDIEIAITKARGVDQRTINHWFKAIWRLGYVIPTGPNKYELNLASIEKLDINQAIITKMDSGSYGKNK